MSNVREVRTSRPVPIMLDKERHLKYDLNAFAEIEEQLGSVDEALESLEKGSIKALRVVLWAGLIHEELGEQGNPKITPRQVGEIVSISDLPKLAEKIGEAMGADLGNPEDVKGVTSNAPLAPRQTVPGTGN